MRTAAAIRLVGDLSKATVVVLGDLVADEYVYGETERVSREAPVLIVRWESSETKPGGAANVAANVAALGARVRPVGLVGSDAAGRALVGSLAALGADTAHVLSLAGRTTETKSRILAGGKSTTRQQMLRLDRADERPLSPSQRTRLRDQVKAALKGADALVVSDYGSGLFDDALIEDVCDIARRKPVCVDSRYALRRFRGVTLAKPNEPELEATMGRKLRTAADVESAGSALLAELRAESLVVTRGRHGMSLFQRDEPPLHVPVWGPGEAVDVTGAGDTVLAALSGAIATGASREDAVRLANVAGGLVVQKPGTATCSAAELVSALRRGEPGPRPTRRRA